MNVNKDISNAWNDIPSPIRGGIYLVGIGIVGFIGYRFYKKWQIDSKAEQIKNDIEAYAKAGIKQSYVDSQYKSWHDTILKEGEALNTDENKIYAIFRAMKNEVDLLKLQEYTYDWGLLFKYNDTLQDYLTKNVLDTDEIDQVNLILKAKRINYQF